MQLPRLRRRRETTAPDEQPGIAPIYSRFAQAARAGARILQSPADYPFGERQYTAEDLGGHRWTFSQSIADVAPASWGGTPDNID